MGGFRLRQNEEVYLKIRSETIIGVEIRIMPGSSVWFIPIKFPD